MEARDSARVDWERLSHRSLREHEKLGGHTLERHVGKSDSFLNERLSRSPRISGASTFTDYASAERTVKSAIKGNKSRILKWLKGARERARLPLDYSGREVVGRGIKRKWNSIREMTGARVILQARSRSDFFVLTAYPN